MEEQENNEIKEMTLRLKTLHKDYKATARHNHTIGKARYYIDHPTKGGQIIELIKKALAHNDDKSWLELRDAMKKWF